MAKMGRPLKDVVKPKIVGVRMTEAEHAELQRRASEHNLSLTQAVQQAINHDAVCLSPKSISNAYGLLSAALGVYAPDLF